MVETYLLDTNVLSALRQGQRHPAVARWMAAHASDDLRISVMTIGEIRLGVERRRRADPVSARGLEVWIDEILGAYSRAMVSITPEVATHWARIMVPDPLPYVDGWIAATALANEWPVVTRNVPGFDRAGVRVINPWEFDG